MPSEKKIKERSLPSQRNPLLQGADIPPYNELVDMRRLGQTNLGSKGGNDTVLFSYVHLRAPLPQPLEGSEIFGSVAPESYFLMRRSQDGYVSSTGMFKASFPWAKKKEEDHERQYVREHFEKTSPDETAGNLWIHPTDALALADDYGMRLWIEALLDNDTAPAPRRRSTRSASPSKRLGSTPRKTRAKAAKDSPLKKEVAPIAEAMEEETEVVTLTTTEKTTLSTETAPVLTNGNGVETSLTTPVKGEPTIKLRVDQESEEKGDVKVARNSEMIAKAKEMVAEAQRLDSGSDVAPVNDVGRKRKVDDIEGAEESEAGEESEHRQTKKSKVLEEELKREKVKNKALIGLTAVLAIGLVSLSCRASPYRMACGLTD
ncbi:hypothetical protein L873DRAFT_1661165 [Choiromyces venosus 120613-1]|uniref:HTH APSES-type domain-containing protein n=1 Tax=Choiromyces venosus 120613-1 TaxID=1336337 RepID=A0A3N4K9L0_9PEZI|nr:hypothetical protein L873DRAFT_1661165 [Choiromyces venosus 120613-1]